MTTPTTPSDPRDDTPADEVFVDEAPSTGPRPDAPPPASGPATMTATAPVTTQPAPAQPQAAPEQTWLQGPAPFPIILGILGLVVAGVVLLGELTDVSLPWNDLGPWSVVAAGIVVLLVGAIGLRSSRNRG